MSVVRVDYIDSNGEYQTINVNERMCCLTGTSADYDMAEEYVLNNYPDCYSIVDVEKV